MPSFVALPALNTLSGARLGTLLGVVTFLLAVLAGVGVDALLGTISGAVTLLRTIDTLNCWCHGDMFGLLLLAVLTCVSDIHLEGHHRSPS